MTLRGHDALSGRTHASPERLRLGSPFEIALSFPSDIWQLGPGFVFVGLLATVFRLPSLYQREREKFWQNRRAADEAKRNWLAEKEQQYESVDIRLEHLELPEEAAEYVDHDDNP